MMYRIRIRTAVRGLLLTAGLWAVLVALALWRDADWPHRTPNLATCIDRATLTINPAACEWFSARYNWSNFLIICFIIEFLWLKSWMMGVMTTRWDRLGESLISANIAFSVVYTYALATILWPNLPYAVLIRDLIRYGLVAVLAWGLVQLLLVPDVERATETVLTDDHVVTQVPVERRSGLERRRNWRAKT